MTGARRAERRTAGFFLWAPAGKNQGFRHRMGQKVIQRLYLNGKIHIISLNRNSGESR